MLCAGFSSLLSSRWPYLGRVWFMSRRRPKRRIRNTSARQTERKEKKKKNRQVHETTETPQERERESEWDSVPCKSKGGESCLFCSFLFLPP
jgi:hypothetical protein